MQNLLLLYSTIFYEYCKYYILKKTFIFLFCFVFMYENISLKEREKGSYIFYGISPQNKLNKFYKTIYYVYTISILYFTKRFKYLQNYLFIFTDLSR